MNNITEAFKDKVLVITGGTGSFGNAVLNRFLTTDIREIRIFSRDEKKQDDMRHEYQAKYPKFSDKIKFYIGDVRDLQSVKAAMHGVDYTVAVTIVFARRKAKLYEVFERIQEFDSA